MIELMIVVAIIGILASAAIPAFLRYMNKARNVEGLHNMAKLLDSATGYYEAHSRFPGTESGPSYWADTDYTPFSHWAQYCERGVFPEAALADFNTGWGRTTWNGLLFKPEGNLRFRYHFDAGGDNAAAWVWGHACAGRHYSCNPPSKYFYYEYNLKQDSQKNVTWTGPYTWGTVTP